MHAPKMNERRAHVNSFARRWTDSGRSGIVGAGMDVRHCDARGLEIRETRVGHPRQLHGVHDAPLRTTPRISDIRRTVLA